MVKKQLTCFSWRTGVLAALVALGLLLIIGSGGGGDDSAPPDETVDQCPDDPLKTEAGLCGCGIPDTDSDNDGTPDCQADETVDQCPVDETKTEEGLCGCGIPDTDTDNDGTPDCQDACPEDPGTMPDESGFCGDTGDAAVIVEGEALTLAVNGAVLTIPADALAPGTAVMLTEIDPSLLDEQPNGPGENRVTPIYALEFSEAQIAGESMSFALDVPVATGSLTYTRIRINGGLATESQSDTDWLPNLGDFDAGQSLLVVALGATANRFLITGLTRADVAASATGEALQMPALMKARVLATPAEAAVSELAWAAHGWVVSCDPEAFAKVNDARCDPLAPGFAPMMNKLGRSLYESDQQLTSLGFPQGKMTLNTALAPALPAVPFPRLVYDPDGRSIATATSSDGGALYWPAWADPRTTDNSLGVYYPSSKQIHIDVDQTPSMTNDTAIHELMHSVQLFEIADAWGENWIIEGLAAAVEPNAPNYSGPTGVDYRYFDDWRDWMNYLTSNEAQNEYQVLEFWLSITGDMSSIPRFYDELSIAYDLGTDANSQQLVDEALVRTGLFSLADAYTDLILTRDGQTDYPQCDGGAFALPLECSGLSCSSLVQNVQPFSAHCSTREVIFETCDNEAPTDITLTLTLETSSPNLKLILGGAVYDANTPVDFPNEGQRYWVINTDLNNQVNTSGGGETAELVFRRMATCGVKLLRQQHSAYARSFLALGPVMDDWTKEEVLSYEDLTEPSYVEVSDEIEPAGVQVPISPLGNDSWGASLSSAVQSEVTTIDYNSSAMASVDVQTSQVATGLLTAGSFTTTAERSTRRSGIGSNGIADSLHYYETGNVAVELNLTWDCDLSIMSVHYVDPATFKDTELIISRVNPAIAAGNWECGKRQFIVPPDTLFRVSFYSAYYASEPGSGVIYFENAGGAFEIDMRNIEE